MSNGPKRSGSNILVFVLFAAMVAATARGLANGRKVAEMGQITAEFEDAMYSARLENRALMKMINNVGWGGTFLQGWDVVGDSAVVLQAPRDGLYYLIKTTCGACPLNYPSLARMEAVSPGVITILALNNDGADIKEYIGNFGPPTAPISMVEGGLVTAVPLYSTPLLLNIRDGNLVDLVTGRIDSLTENRIVAGLSSR